MKLKKIIQLTSATQSQSFSNFSHLSVLSALHPSSVYRLHYNKERMNSKIYFVAKILLVIKSIIPKTEYEEKGSISLFNLTMKSF